MSEKSIWTKVLVGVFAIALGSGGCYLNMLSKIEQNKITSTRQEILEITMALKVYEEEYGRPLPVEQGLSTLITNTRNPNWKGPFLTPSKRGLVDQWGTPYRYELIGTNPAVISAGPDGQFGTRDDMTETPNK